MPKRDPLFDNLQNITPHAAWGESTGAGVRVGIVDSGIEQDHEALGGAVAGGVEVIMDHGRPVIRVSKPVRDDFGHGTACAGIIHRIAPDAELHSIKVLGATSSGSGDAFVAGVEWAIENEMDVVNLSLGTTREQFAAPFHKLVDRAYYQGCLLIAAANNHPPPSIPSIFSGLLSVRAGPYGEPSHFSYSSRRPIEIEAAGVSVRCPWLGGTYRRLTGTSFAAPHITGLVARMKAQHPWMTPFQVKTVLCSIGTRNLAEHEELILKVGSRGVRQRRRRRAKQDRCGADPHPGASISASPSAADGPPGGTLRRGASVTLSRSRCSGSNA